MNLQLNLQLAVEASVPDEKQFCHWIGAALSAASAGLSQRAEVTVRVVDADEMTALNRDYRHIDKVTNVLSFPLELPMDIDDRELELLLGDIVICAEVVEAEARDQGKASEAHWAHMVTHGTLHLLGYDHIEAVEADEMEALEAQILGAQGYDNPYAEAS